MPVETKRSRVDSVQAQGMVGCRIGIVEVDGAEIGGIRHFEGTALKS